MPRIENEVDATEYFKTISVTGLETCTNMESALNRFGYSKDDRIERRELVLIFRSVEKQMETEIHNLAHSGLASGYAKAKQMRETLISLRKEFDSLQIQVSQKKRDDQVQLFEKATSLAKQKHAGAMVEEEAQLAELIEEMNSDIALSQRIERQNLEKQISRIPRPKMLYSKRTVELFRSETELIRLCQYDDAQKVRYMLKRILPGEERKFYEKFDAKIAKMRSDLAKSQEEAFVRHNERIKTMKIKGVREVLKKSNLEKQRIKNHLKDMSHTHKMESTLKAEMSVHPSALWKKRPGYVTTSASNRGQQLIDYTKGFDVKRIDTTVFTDTLTEKHSFSDSMQDTLTLQV
jgi:hypothetical protein